MSAVIRDGLTLPATIPALPGAYDEIHYKYRPALRSAIQEFLRKRAIGSTKDIIEAEDRLIRQYVVEWDAQDHEGNHLPVEKTLASGWYSVVQNMIDHICGFAGPDVEACLGNSSTGSGSN